MRKRVLRSGAASLVALLAAAPAWAQADTGKSGEGAAQEEPAVPLSPAQDATLADQGDQTEDIVVTGIRSSLERAAEIKQEAVQVVDSIVAQDIGKFPDPTTAAALQRVPGVQVQNDANNELSGVRIRGLTDITTTVDGREVFTTSGRNFDLQDLSAEALARVDVYKSQTADLIEGGVAGAINLRLNKPFNFREPTLVLSARGNYGIQVEELNPLFGVLATDRWQTGIGEIGLLVNATVSDADSLRMSTNLNDRRDSAASPLLRPGYFVPNVLLNITQKATVKRSQANVALQWAVSPSLEAYVDGLYTRFKNTSNDSGFNVQPFTTNVGITDIVANADCFQVRATAAGQNPTLRVNADGTSTLQPSTVKTLCDVDQATLTNAVANQTTGSDNFTSTNKLIAGGLRFDQQGSKMDLDVSYQSSESETANVRTAVGQRVPSMTFVTDDDGGSRLVIPGDVLIRRDTLSLRNQLIQNFNEARGDLLQARVDGEQELGGPVSKVQVGLRYADRSASFTGVASSIPVPFGNIGTPSEARARLVSQTNLPAAFLALSESIPG